MSYKSAEHAPDDLPPEWTWLLFDEFNAGRAQRLEDRLNYLVTHISQAQRFITKAEQDAWKAFRECM